MSEAMESAQRTASVSDEVDRILAEATLTEKVAMMSGRGFFDAFRRDGNVWGASPYQAGAGCERLGVPALYFTDGPRGVSRGHSTCFPVTMARGASFDRDLERRIGEVMGIEARAQGCNLSGAVCINLLRHPGWGRAQETYGEDTYHLGEMGAQLAKGIQAHNVIATVKHFALNSIENSRFKVNVTIGERALREVYLPHFKKVLDEGCLSVMSAYNKLNGEYCGQNHDLLTGILRDDWGFEGFVHSDWVLGVYEPYAAAAGLDIENPEPKHFAERLVEAVESGTVSRGVVDRACRRILTTLLEVERRESPLAHYSETLVACDAHRALAHEAALKSAVLLRNEGGALPFRDTETGTIAVTGRLADLENTGDAGSSSVHPTDVVTTFAGLQNRFGEDRVKFAGDEQDPAAAALACEGAALAIVVVGYTAADEGEYIPGDISLSQGPGSANEEQAQPKSSAEAINTIGGDRRSLSLPEEQMRLVREVASRHPRTVVVIHAGSAVLVETWVDEVAAIIQPFYNGMEGGNALAALIAGDASPSGKLPFTVARDPEDYPPFDPDADEVKYDLWHGYRRLDRTGRSVRFVFGHGLSYSEFSYRAPRVRRRSDGALEVTVSVRNAGNCEAAEVAQLYVELPGRIVTRPRRILAGFERVELAPGDIRTVEFKVDREQLCYWDANLRTWRFEPGTYHLRVGGSSDESSQVSCTIDL